MERIHDFHIALRDRHIDELNRCGSTTCNSPFIRKLIYQELKRPYTTKVVGWGKYYRDVDKTKSAYPSIAMKHLRRGHYDLNNLLEVNKSIKDICGDEKEGFDEGDIKKLFDESVDQGEKFKIICHICSVSINYKSQLCLLTYARKPILEISYKN